ncbi:MAG: potassium/proton antiporter [Actinomycetota bacterium]
MDPLILIGAALLFAAVLVAALGARPGSQLRIPGTLLFLGIGMLVGDDGLALIRLDDTELVRDLGIVALLFILFEGGLTTKPTDLRLAAVPALLLSTVGVVVTAGITGGGVWLLLDVEPLTAALIGAVVASTDAAAVFSMMRTTPLPRRVSALLRIESGANDPVAVILTVGLLAAYEGTASGAGDWVWFVSVQLFAGLLVGGAIGAGGVWLLRRIELGIDGLYPVLAASIGGIAYGLTSLVGGSGFVAVYVTGVAIGSLVPRRRRSVLGFHEALANAAEVGLFLLLGLLVFPSRLPSVAVPALLVALVLIVVARPVAVALCTLGSRYGWREQTVVGWAGLRGALPIVLATFPYTVGVPQGDTIFDVVFFVVLVSVLVQGTSLLPLVRALGLEERRAAWAPVAEALPLDWMDVDLVELVVTEEMPLAGCELREVGRPPRTQVTAVVRADEIVIPTGETRLQAGDILLMTTQGEDDALDTVIRWARGETSGGDAGPADGQPGDGKAGDGQVGDDR